MEAEHQDVKFYINQFRNIKYYGKFLQTQNRATVLKV